MSVLPEPVRVRVVSLAADVLGSMRTEDVPPRLRPVAKFAAGKRVRLGAGAIAAALEADAGFRGRVLEAAAAAMPGLAEALAQGTTPAAADPVDVAVVAYLQRLDGWETAVKAAEETADHAEAVARAAREAAAAVRLREQLEAARASAREARDRYRREVDRLKAENAGLRRRLGEARDRAAVARGAEHAAESELSRAVDQAEAARAIAEAEVRRLRVKLVEAEAALEEFKRANRQGRGLETARLGLLLDTLTEAAAGLRRELALPATSIRPADTVQASGPSGESVPAHGRARSADDPAHLAELLALPRVHLVVDGYNVTKSAWPAMPLEAQRTRLVQALGALAARTGAEVTCVFDGADVSVPPPVGAAAGVRVRFSPKGETADELIRRLVRAEPEGRAVVVVSSDREVADGVRRPGVRPVPAHGLIGLIG
ncbi:MAG TPA: NYN domain-containing protein [Jiangellales bacterium]|nr:NYN domain-containing protein [Jiangellales bacterium]